MKRVLYMPLRKEWYEMIERGEKREEYRTISPYWMERLLKCSRLPPTADALMSNAGDARQRTGLDSRSSTPYASLMGTPCGGWPSNAKE